MRESIQSNSTVVEHWYEGRLLLRIVKISGRWRVYAPDGSGGSKAQGSTRAKLYEARRDATALLRMSKLTLADVDTKVIKPKRASKDPNESNRDREALARLTVLASESGKGVCFQYAQHLAMKQRLPAFESRNAFQVVHGKVYVPELQDWYDHAWVETGGLAFDWQTRETHPNGIPVAKFRADRSASDMTAWSAHGAMVNLTRIRKHGPWYLSELHDPGVVIPGARDGDTLSKKHRALQAKRAFLRGRKG